MSYDTHIYPLVRVENLSKKLCKNIKRSMVYGIADLATDFLGFSQDVDTLRKDEFWVLKDINFELKKGDSLGIVGFNGAGKTTLTRLITGAYLPTVGKVIMRGKVAALFAVTGGMDPLFSGRENIYLRGAILGMGREEVDEKMGEIIAFSELEEFIDAPFGLYSSGMKQRLGFAVSIATEPDIIIIDEGLAVGDLAFREKCFMKLREMRENCIQINVTQAPNQVLGIANKMMILNKGRVIHFTDDVDSAIAFYNEQCEFQLQQMGISTQVQDRESTFRKNRRKKQLEAEQAEEEEIVVAPPIEFEPISSIYVYSETFKEAPRHDRGQVMAFEPVVVEFNYFSELEELDGATIEVQCIDAAFQKIASTTSDLYNNFHLLNQSNIATIKVELHNLCLPPGDFDIDLGIRYGADNTLFKDKWYKRGITVSRPPVVEQVDDFNSIWTELPPTQHQLTTPYTEPQHILVVTHRDTPDVNLLVELLAKVNPSANISVRHDLPYQQPITNQSVIYYVADGRDVLCETLSYFKKHIDNDRDTHLILADAIQGDRNILPNWSVFTQFWLPYTQLVIRREDVIANWQVVVEHIQKTFSMQWTAENIDFSPPPFNTQPLTKGAPGYWQEVLNRADTRTFWAQHGTTMEALGYTQAGDVLPTHISVSTPAIEPIAPPILQRLQVVGAHQKPHNLGVLNLPLHTKIEVELDVWLPQTPERYNLFILFYSHAQKRQITKSSSFKSGYSIIGENNIKQLHIALDALQLPPGMYEIGLFVRTPDKFYYRKDRIQPLRIEPAKPTFSAQEPLKATWIFK